MTNIKLNPFKNKNLTEEQKEKINKALNEVGSMSTMYNYVGINPQVESKEWLMKHYSFDEKKADSFYEIANILNGMKEEKLFAYEDIETISKNEGFNALALHVWKQEIVFDK